MKTLLALAALMLTATVASAFPISTYPKGTTPEQWAAHEYYRQHLPTFDGPTAVWVAGEYMGQDPDSGVRLALSKSYGVKNAGGGGGDK